MLEVFVEKGSPNGHKITIHGKVWSIQMSYDDWEMQIRTMSQADEAVGCEPGDVVVVVREQELEGQ